MTRGGEEWKNPQARPVEFPRGHIYELLEDTFDPLDYSFFLISQFENRWILTGKDNLSNFLALKSPHREQVFDIIRNSYGAQMGEIKIQAVPHTTNTMPV